MLFDNLFTKGQMMDADYIATRQAEARALQLVIALIDTDLREDPTDDELIAMRRRLIAMRERSLDGMDDGT